MIIYWIPSIWKLFFLNLDYFHWFPPLFLGQHFSPISNFYWLLCFHLKNCIKDINRTVYKLNILQTIINFATKSSMIKLKISNKKGDNCVSSIEDFGIIRTESYIIKSWKYILGWKIKLVFVQISYKKFMWIEP
jgi:hypothetical protein